MRKIHSTSLCAKSCLFLSERGQDLSISINYTEGIHHAWNAFNRHFCVTVLSLHFRKSLALWKLTQKPKIQGRGWQQEIKGSKARGQHKNT